MSASTTRILGAAIVIAAGFTLACQAPPTATDDARAGPASLGRGNDQGARFWLPGEHTCAVVDGVGALVRLPCALQVATPSANSNAMVVVRASGINNPTGKTVNWGPENPGFQWAGLFYLTFGLTGPPYPCGVKIGPGSTYFVDIVFTLNWHATVTPEGKATITCHYSDKWAWLPPLP
jgi:hypothetical protein